MTRLLTVWCAEWSATATGLGHDRPLAVVRANRVRAASPAALAAGVTRGMRRREAQARCPDLTVTDDNPDRDARVFEPVVRAIGDLVPLLEVTEPGLLTFPSRGPSRYCGGDEALLSRVQQIALNSLRTTFGELAVPMPAVGLADGRFASAVAARRSHAKGRPVLVPRGKAHSAAFLERFPVAVLHEVADVPDDVVGLLRRLGYRTLGEVAALPATDLLARFGPHGTFIHELVTGADGRHAETREPPAELTVRHDFDDPVVQIESIVFGARRLAEALYERLAALGTVCSKLLVEAETEFGERTERVWYHQVGMRPAAMVERIRWQLDGWVRQPGGLSGGVVSYALTPLEIRADHGRQLGFWGEATQADEWATRAMTRIAGLFGPDAVTVPVWEGGRSPAALYRQVPANLLDLDATELAARAAAVRPATDQAWPGSLPRPQPAALTIEPRPCDVLDDRDHDVLVTGRGLLSAAPATMRLGERTRAIAAWAGPWPIEERWWDPAAAKRCARLQLVTDDGQAYLVTRAGSQWSVEATYA